VRLEIFKILNNGKLVALNQPVGVHFEKILVSTITTNILGFAFAQGNDTIAKVKASGSVTMGIRDP